MSGAKLDATHPPEGWRLIRDGETQPEEQLVWTHGIGPWEPPNGSLDVGLMYDSRRYHPVAIRITKPAPKPLKWEPVDLIRGIDLGTTKTALRDIIGEASDTINKLGRELTRLKNQSRKAKA